MIVSINQPAYLPWLGYFHRIAVSDSHIILDHVQFEKNGFTNRNKVRTHEGWSWLTVPVQTSGKFGDLPIHCIKIANEQNWASKHWQTLQFNYSKAPFFAQHAAYLEDLYKRPWLRLADLANEVTRYLLDAFGIHTKCYRSSEMSARGRKDELLLNLCLELGATTYLSGPLGRNYLREDLFNDHGITLRYDDYQHPTYPQVYTGFEAYMSAVDLLFNTGPASLEIILKNQTLKSQENSNR